MAGLIPKAPVGVSVDANMKLIRSKFGKIVGPGDYYQFYQMVRNKGVWDYKQRGSQFESFGNFNYGAVGTAAGIPAGILLNAAGCAQELAGTSTSNWGSCIMGIPPYSDDPNDQKYIKLGIQYAKQKGY